MNELRALVGSHFNGLDPEDLRDGTIEEQLADARALLQAHGYSVYRTHNGMLICAVTEQPCAQSSPDCPCTACQEWRAHLGPAIPLDRTTLTSDEIDALIQEADEEVAQVTPLCRHCGRTVRWHGRHNSCTTPTTLGRGLTFTAPEGE